MPKWFSPKRKGSAPQGFVPIALGSDWPQHLYQVKQSYPWPGPSMQQTRAALTNFWQGNQLPGQVNFIPGVNLSKFTWNVPTAYMNTLRNQQYNVAFNTQGMSSVQSATLQAQIVQAWQNRSGL